jgi:hypothetical protein
MTNAPLRSGTPDPIARYPDDECRARRLAANASLRIYAVTMLFPAAALVAWHTFHLRSWRLGETVPMAGFIVGLIVNRWLTARWWRWLSTQPIAFELMAEAAERNLLTVPRDGAFPGFTPLERAIRGDDQARRDRS